MLYRIKQFLWSAVARLSGDDTNFIGTYLNEEERRLFYRLPRAVQVHSVKVAKGVLKESLEKGLFDIRLMKASLLHDVGKINGGLNLVTKSIMVISDKFFPVLVKRFARLKWINAYYNHPEIAIEFLDSQDDYIRYLIRNHHNYNINGDEKLKILQKIDSLN